MFEDVEGTASIPPEALSRLNVLSLFVWQLNQANS